MILYRGPSLIDGQPIVVAVTGYKGASANSKTGSMLQTWILPANIEPHLAVKTGADRSVCGDCPQRQGVGEERKCYVTMHQAPLSVYRAIQRGTYNRPEYKRAYAKFAANRGAYSVRLGAYGDPAAVPSHVWSSLTRGVAKVTGYTHQWLSPAGMPSRVLEWSMASVDSAEQARIAYAAGLRFFQVVADGETPHHSAIECRATATDSNCADCGACNGTRIGRDKQPPSFWIRAHGARKNGRKSLPVMS